MQKPFRSKNDASHCLYSVAEAQAGFFTAKQAKKAGFSASSHTYNVRKGHWEREYRGIYRLSSFPAVLRPELVRLHLWSMDRTGQAQGVYSHSTALGLYLTPEAAGLPDVHPELEMTVPKSFRRMSATPEGLTLHYADLPESDIAARNGYRLTTPLRTILDLAAGDLATGDAAAADTMPRAELSKALQRILERGLITPEQAKGARIPEAAQLQLEELLGRKNW
jgi:putative AbiEi antitoxin of type IV toxin-antitoxin system